MSQRVWDQEASGTIEISMLYHLPPSPKLVWTTGIGIHMVVLYISKKQKSKKQKSKGFKSKQLKSKDFKSKEQISKEQRSKKQISKESKSKEL